MGNIANTPLSEAEQIFKSLIWDPLVLSGEASLFLAIPVLNTPILRKIETALIHKLSDWLWDQIRLLIDIEAIRLVNSEHQVAFANASLKLRVIALEKGIDSDEFKQARDSAARDLAKFTNFGH